MCWEGLSQQHANGFGWSYSDVLLHGHRFQSHVRDSGSKAKWKSQGCGCFKSYPNTLLKGNNPTLSTSRLPKCRCPLKCVLADGTTLSIKFGKGYYLQKNSSPPNPQLYLELEVRTVLTKGKSHSAHI